MWLSTSKCENLQTQSLGFRPRQRFLMITPVGPRLGCQLGDVVSCNVPIQQTTDWVQTILCTCDRVT